MFLFIRFDFFVVDLGFLYLSCLNYIKQFIGLWKPLYLVPHDLCACAYTPTLHIYRYIRSSYTAHNMCDNLNGANAPFCLPRENTQAQVGRSVDGKSLLSSQFISYVYLTILPNSNMGPPILQQNRRQQSPPNIHPSRLWKHRCKRHLLRRSRRLHVRPPRPQIGPLHLEHHRPVPHQRRRRHYLPRCTTVHLAGDIRYRRDRDESPTTHAIEDHRTEGGHYRQGQWRDQYAQSAVDRVAGWAGRVRVDDYRRVLLREEVEAGGQE